MAFVSARILRCEGCSNHQLTTRHDEKKYKLEAEKAADAIRAVFGDDFPISIEFTMGGLEIILLCKSPPSSSSPPVLIFSKTQKGRFPKEGEIVEKLSKVSKLGINEINIIHSTNSLHLGGGAGGGGGGGAGGGGVRRPMSAPLGKNTEEGGGEEEREGGGAVVTRPDSTPLLMDWEKEGGNQNEIGKEGEEGEEDDDGGESDNEEEKQGENGINPPETEENISKYTLEPLLLSNNETISSSSSSSSQPSSSKEKEKSVAGRRPMSAVPISASRRDNNSNNNSVNRIKPTASTSAFSSSIRERGRAAAATTSSSSSSSSSSSNPIIKRGGKGGGGGGGPTPLSIPAVLMDELMSAAAERRALRNDFVRVALSYCGVPYEKKAVGGSNAHRSWNSHFHLDCCGLIRQTIFDLRHDFKFELRGFNQSYQFDTLPLVVNSEKELQLGDLIFVQGEFYDPKKKRQVHDIVHVEIFLGGDNGLKTVGARFRHGVVQIHESYRFESKKYEIKAFHFRSIDTWLAGCCRSFCPEHRWQNG